MTAKRILINYETKFEERSHILNKFTILTYFPKIVVVNFVWFLSLDPHAHVQV